MMVQISTEILFLMSFSGICMTYASMASRQKTLPFPASVPVALSMTSTTLVYTFWTQDVLFLSLFPIAIILITALYQVVSGWNFKTFIVTLIAIVCGSVAAYNGVCDHKHNFFPYLTFVCFGFLFVDCLIFGTATAIRRSPRMQR